jgi:hypothetical protein
MPSSWEARSSIARASKDDTMCIWSIWAGMGWLREQLGLALEKTTAARQEFLAIENVERTSGN